MPDWFYRTLSQPVLFALSPERGRNLALGMMGRLARLPLGKYAIDVLGHMVPDARLALRHGALRFCTPVGIGHGLDMQLQATHALRRFGAGLIEVGPVGSDAAAPRNIRRDVVAQTLIWDGEHCLSIAQVLARLPKRIDPRITVLARLQPDQPDELVTQCAALKGKVQAVAIAAGHATAARVQAAGLPLLAVLDAQQPDDVIRAHTQSALAMGCAGVLVDATLGAVRVFGATTLAATLAATRAARASAGPDALILSSGGIHQPQDALDVYAAGATIAMVDSGMVFGGPGLIKRIDDALMHRLLEPHVAAPDVEFEPSRSMLAESWPWLFLFGLALLLGSIIAIAIALGPVLLPYDEVFIAHSVAQLMALNPRLPGFLTHDRITLAGIMATVGICYSGLAWNGARRGWHWAEGTVLVSATIGALTFFGFLGFGYLEPFHAFVSTIMTIFLVAAFRSTLAPAQHWPAPVLRESPAWQRALWGQLCWILFGIGLLGAGLAISAVGISTVFVPSDLDFIGGLPGCAHGADCIASLHPRLLPLIAHDRATVGGMLISAGFCYLLSSMWGFRRGERWLWRTLVLAALPAFACVVWVHWHIGYLDTLHLAPVWGALALWATGAWLSHAHLCEKFPDSPSTGRAD